MIIVSRNIRYIRQMYLIFLETRIISRLGIFTSVPWGGASNDRGLSKSTIFIVCYSLYVDYRQDIHRLHEKRGHSILDITVTNLVSFAIFGTNHPDTSGYESIRKFSPTWQYGEEEMTSYVTSSKMPLTKTDI